MRKLVSSPAQATANIQKFAGELAKSPELQATLGHVHAWYALRMREGVWVFGPSKFVGYQENTAKKYLQTYQANADGRETERVLREWFSPVEPSSRLERELKAELEAFLRQWNRRPRKGARISIVSDEPAALLVAERKIGELLLNRIVTDPDVCSGRPCIRGTRLRVSDVVDMLAAGVTRVEILKDYPYITDEDISAALSYAARSTDHRVIRAA